MAKHKLTELASVIRSKNSGPYELTFDVIFKDFETFYKVKEAQAINKQNFCEIYGIPESDIFHLVYFDPAKAVKVTIRRPIASGALGETDVYGAQQHAPLMALEIEF
ncbi:MAG: DUF4387 domain-containing protein [Muribaculaceae bacterium]|jgi:hypothetical protein|nr:DUF4387 domain-containing protein [Muribaculaceae bacterium]MBQ1185852.1 DUF4387 domain-containing protein [Muribaculaceae bacterium]MBQ2371401.1 DUF4387 domain-containing protein [Muribaculaceae bacterium]MBQ2399572.1 DUF4387 domain-containing protein [Muribaculaceae bacterium]MBQ5723443.1 DUF4387 domain-containing protein [Muribaculaceae bacterium]